MSSLRSSTTLAPTGSQNAAASPGPQIACPPGLAADDLLVVGAYYAQGNGSQGFYEPEGLLKVSTNGDASNRQAVIYVAVVEDPADFEAGITIRSAPSATRIAAVAEAWTPTAGMRWDIGSVSCLGPEFNGSAMTSDTYPVGLERTLLLGFAMTNKSASTLLTQHNTIGGGTDGVQARALSAASGSVSDSVLSVFRDGSGVAFVQSADGTSSLAQANGQTYRFGINEVSTSPEPEGLPPVTGKGFGTVERMLRTRYATWAHRGLGLTYPEMTEYACRRAANNGFGIIELSLQRTSGGAGGDLIGAHDNTPNRVTVETTYDGQNFSTLSTAQVLSLHINVGGTGAPQPYATFAQLVSTLPDDFIFLVDNKPGSYYSEFLDQVDALLGPTRAIIKVDGTNRPTTDLQAARARGYVTAAYFYDTTPSSKIAEMMPYTDLPGLNYDADESYWGAMLAYGKPIWGHVCPDQAAHDMAIAKGATYVQCTSAAISPVGVSSWRPGALASGFAPAEIYAGSAPVAKVFHGSNLIWSRE